MRKKFIRHETCPACHSKDNLSIYELPDGQLTGFCYTPRCSYNKQKDKVVSPAVVATSQTSDSTTKQVDYQEILNTLQPSNYLVKRGIAQEIQKRYKVGEFSGHIYFPYYDASNYCRGFKYRDADKNFRWLSNEGGSKLFGIQASHNAKTTVVIYEGEVDALSGAMMDSRFNHLSIFNAQSAKSCLIKETNFLSSFDRIILCFDNDQAGLDATEECKDLFPGKLYITTFPNKFKDANEMLTQGKQLQFLEMLDSAKRVVPENFLSKEDIVSQVLDSIYRNDDLKGIPTGFPTLDKACGGLRGGELITVSAGTGVGKTRYILQLIYNLARQGHKSLLYPLEMDYKSIFYLLSEKHLRHNWIGADKKPPSEEEMKQCMEFLSQYVIPYNYVGALDIDKLKASIEYTVANEGVKFIFIDHKDAAVMSSDWKDIDKFYSELKRLSIQLKVCFIVVSHVSRSSSDKEDNKIELNRIRGSQGVAQYSDFVIGLERERDSSDTLVKTLKAHRLFAGFEEFWISHNWDTMQIEEINNATKDESKVILRTADSSSKSLSPVRTSEASLQTELSSGLPSNKQEREEDLHRSQGVHERSSHEETQSSQENEPRNRLTTAVSKPESTDQQQEPKLDDIRAMGREKRVSLELRNNSTGSVEVGIAFDLETKGLFVNGKAPDILCASYAYYDDMFETPVSGTLTDLNEIKRFLMESKQPLIFHNAAFDVSVLKYHGLWDERFSYHDTQLMSYVLNPTNEHSLKACAERLSLEQQKFNHPWEGKFPTEVTPELLIYAEQDAVVTYQVACKFWQQLQEDKELLRLYKQIELPFSQLLIEMQLNGMQIDLDKASSVGAEIKSRLATIESEITSKYPQPTVEKFYKRARPELGEAVRDRGGFIYNVPVAWNLNSNDHKAQLLKLDGWVPDVMTKSGKPQVSKDILADLNLPVAKMLQEYAQLTKVLTSFIDPLTNLVDPDNRVHTNLNQTVTKTGRLSSSNPNLQNIPARKEIGKTIRSLFTAPEGMKIVDGDLSAIEARLLALYIHKETNSERLVKVFQEGTDLHQSNADEFGLTRDEAKTWLYLTIYGGGVNKLASSLNISVPRAQKIMSTVEAKFPELFQTRDSVVDFCRKHGYVKTLFGRKLFYPAIHSKDKAARAEAERQVFNAVLQGSAADVIKALTIKSKELAEKYQSEFVMQVHDELIFYTPDNLAEDFAKALTELWSSQEWLHPVPLLAEFQTGLSWGEVH